MVSGRTDKAQVLDVHHDGCTARREVRDGVADSGVQAELGAPERNDRNNLAAWFGGMILASEQLTRHSHPCGRNVALLFNSEIAEELLQNNTKIDFFRQF